MCIWPLAFRGLHSTSTQYQLPMSRAIKILRTHLIDAQLVIVIAYQEACTKPSAMANKWKLVTVPVLQ